MKILTFRLLKYRKKPKTAAKIDSGSSTGEHCLFLVLSRPRSIVASIIQAYTRDTYTHASISFSSSLSEMYSFSRKWSYYPFIGRLSCERFDKGFLKRCSYLPGLVMKITLPAVEYEKAKRLVENMLSHKQLYKYDMRGFFGNIFNISTSSDTRFTCSKFVAYILCECGAAVFDQGLSLVRPQMLATVKGDVVYRGDLKQYGRKKTNQKPEPKVTDVAV